MCYFLLFPLYLWRYGHFSTSGVGIFCDWEHKCFTSNECKWGRWGVAIFCDWEHKCFTSNECKWGRWGKWNPRIGMATYIKTSDAVEMFNFSVSKTWQDVFEARPMHNFFVNPMNVNVWVASNVFAYFSLKRYVAQCDKTGEIEPHVSYITAGY